MWLLILSPLLAFLPKRGRDRLQFSGPLPWVLATIISGFVEFRIALVSLFYCYSHSFETWVELTLDATIQANPGAAKVPPTQIGFAGMILWALHPLSWLIAFFVLEGVVRLLGAGISQSVRGTFPLYFLERGIAKAYHLDPPAESNPQMSARNFLGSFAQAMQERVRLAMSDPIAHEVRSRSEGGEEILEIYSQRLKENWTPPRIVSISETHYSLRASLQVQPPRPYLFILHKLPTGVPGRSVLVYGLEKVK